MDSPSDDDPTPDPGERWTSGAIGASRWRLGAGAVMTGVLLSLCAVPANVPEPVAVAEATPAPTPVATPTPTPTPVGPPAPLTGSPTADAILLDRRVLAVKIDNHDDARPQTGLNEADAVLELPVESGLTRFIALFHTSDLEVVGPVRSGRPTDPTLVRSLDATLLISGAQPWIVSVIRNTGVPLFVDIGQGITFRSPDRFAPNNLYGNTSALRLAADRRGIADTAPPTWFARDVSHSIDGPTTRTVVMPWSDETTVTWELEGELWRRNHNGSAHVTLAADGSEQQVSVDHLVFIAARAYTARNPVDGGGVPALDTVGSGDAWVALGGDEPQWEKVSWSRSSVEDLVELTHDDGRTVVLPPGRLWVSWIRATRAPQF